MTIQVRLHNKENAYLNILKLSIADDSTNIYHIYHIFYFT